MRFDAFEMGVWLQALAHGDLPPESLQTQLLEAARHHGIHLVAYRMGSSPGQVPLRQALSCEARLAVAGEVAQQTELCLLFAAFKGASLQPILLKGSALAYSLYSEPWERPRSDIDLLVAEQEAPDVRHVLGEAGYRPETQTEEPLVTRQFQMVRVTPGGFRHHVDVHWRVLNPASATDILTFSDACARAIHLPNLSDDVRGLATADAMLLACVHRVVHHDDSDRLIWLYDIHLLSGALDQAGWQRVVESALAARVRAVVRASLTKTHLCLGTRIPDDVMRALEAGPDEPTASYLGGGRRQIAIEWLNVRDTRSWSSRLSLVRQHLLPDPAYILAKYGRHNRAWLPLLYARRILEGAPGWLRRRQ